MPPTPLPAAAQWEVDRQLVLMHIQNVLLALRSSTRFSSKTRFSELSPQNGGHPLLQMMLSLRKKVLAATSITTSVFPDGSGNSISSSGGSNGRDVDDKTTSESAILSAFGTVCRSPLTSETITSVALSALHAMVETPCAFITAHGLNTIIDAAENSRSDIADSVSHEVLVGRMITVFAACLRHREAENMPEATYIRLVSRVLVVSLRLEASPLLKRSAENVMNTLVTTLYKRVVDTPTAGVGAALSRRGQSESKDRSGHYDVAASAVSGTPLRRPTGAPMLAFISSLISGDITALDEAGNSISVGEVNSDSPRGNSVATSPGSPVLLTGSPNNGTLSYAQKVAVVSDSGTAIQLEGLYLAQFALLAVKHRLDDVQTAGPLRRAVQDDLSRALLIAGVRTTHVVVLSQILRTVHLAIQCASGQLVRQMFSFLRALHLVPLATLTEELRCIEGGGGGPGGGAPGGTSSPPPASVNATFAALLPQSPLGTGGAFEKKRACLTQAQILEMHERRELLLESLAEFCSDSRFASFCYVHYDLSFRWAPLLPQICDVLMSIAIGAEGLAGTVAGGAAGAAYNSVLAGRIEEQSMSSGSRGVSPSPAGVSTSSGAVGITSMQLTALDAIANLVSGLAVRASSARRCSSVKPSMDNMQVQPEEGQQHGEIACRVGAQIKGMIEQKRLLQQFAALFKESPLKKGVVFLLEHAVRVPRGQEATAMAQYKTWLVLAEPAGGAEVGECLYRLNMVLDKRTLGDYIGDLGRDPILKPSDDQVAELAEWEKTRETDHLKPGTIRFFEEQLKAFVHQLNFTGKSLLASIREMVYSLCLPGESQKIDRVMEAFAKHWMAQNPPGVDLAINPFETETGAFVLSFAIIMLNTDLHSGRMRKHMGPRDFKMMNRGIDSGKSVTEDYLGAIYEDVKQHEIIMAEMMNRGFSNDVTWNLEMNWAMEPLGIESVDSHTLSHLTLGAGVDHACTSRTDADVTLEVVEGFVCRAMWTRCLDVFGGMINHAADFVARVGVRGSASTLASVSPLSDALEDVRRKVPMELAALETGLAGVGCLAQAACDLGLWEVCDQCVLQLLFRLSFINVTHSGAEDGFAVADEVATMVYTSLPTLLTLKEVFSVLLRLSGEHKSAVDVTCCLSDSWQPLSHLLVQLYVLGMVASKPTTTEEASLSSSNACVSGLMCEDPGIVFVSSGDLRPDGTIAAAATARSSGGGGWFSSLFGSGNGAINAAQEDKAQRAERLVQHARLQECIPDARVLLASLGASLTRYHRLWAHAQGTPQDTANSGNYSGAPARFAAALCTAVDALQTRAFRERFLASYGINVLSAVAAEVALAECTPVTNEANIRSSSGEGHDVGNEHHDSSMSSTVGMLLSCMERQLIPTLKVLEKPVSVQRTTMGRDRFVDSQQQQSTELSVGEFNYYLSVAQRMVSAVVSLLMRLVHSGVSHTSGALRSLQEQTLTLLITRAPGGRSFALAIAPILSAALYEALLRHCQRLENQRVVNAVSTGASAYAASASLSVEVDTLLSIVFAVVTRLSPKEYENDAVPQLRSIVYHTTKHCMYDVATHTESILDATLALCLPREASQDGGNTISPVSQCLSSQPTSAIRESRHRHAEPAGCVGGAPVQLNIAAPTHLEDGSAADILGYCSRNIIRASQVTSSDADWHKLWILSLKSLCALVCCAQTARDGTEGLFNLQRSLLDTGIREFPAPAIVAVYDEVLFPLVDRLCTCCRDGAAVGITGCASAASSAIAPIEVKCRVINLLPKALLQYTSAFDEAPEILQALWRKVLGTLYAVYSAYPSSPEEASTAGLADEAAQMREAVEETVKNMVYVMAATLTDTPNSAPPKTFMRSALQFWSSTQDLVRPFDFSAPLLNFMESLTVSAVAT